MTLSISRSRSPYDHYLNKLGRPHIPSLKVIGLLALEENILKGFYCTLAWWSPGPTSFPYPKEFPYEI